MRDVYFDPFGSYTQGYDKGTQRQMELEQNTRAARDSDYKFNVLNPYELKGIKREDAFGDFAVPGRQALYNDTVFNSGLAINKNWAQISGDSSQLTNPFIARYGYTPGAVAPGAAVAATYAPPTQPTNNYLPQGMPSQPTAAPTTAQPMAAGGVDPGAAYWNEVRKLGRRPLPAEGEQIAYSIAKQYSIPMFDLQQRIAGQQTQQPFSQSGEPYVGAYAPAPADAPMYTNAPAPTAAPNALAPYNIGTQPMPQQPQQPMQPQQVYYDASGKPVPMFNDLSGSAMNWATQERQDLERAFLQKQWDTYNAQQQAEADRMQKYYYDETVRQQTAANAGRGAGTGEWSTSF
jgi:hypothetical protein